MEELGVEVNVNMSVELQITVISVVAPFGSKVRKPLEKELVPHVGRTVQVMRLPLLVHWYDATSLEHTGPSPTS